MAKDVRDRLASHAPAHALADEAGRGRRDWQRRVDEERGAIYSKRISN